MSNSVPQDRSRLDAVRNENQPTQRALPDFEPASPIDREIERSQRASAALATAAAVARAAFTDSQLQAEAAAAEADVGDIDTAAWIRTEYASLDHSVSARHPSAGRPLAGHADPSSSRNPVIGTFDPGLTALNAHVFPGSSIASARPGSPGHGRGTAQVRFMQESRLTPRAAKVVNTAARIEEHLAAHAAHYDKPEVMPMLATPPAAPARAPAARRAPAGERAKLMLAAGMGAVVVLMAGGVAWKSGMLSRGGNPADGALVTASVAKHAEAARMLAGNQEIRMAPPAAGVRAASATAPVDVDAILAAAARVVAPPAPAAEPPAATPVALEVATPARAPAVTVPHVVARAAFPAAAPVATTRATAPAGPRSKDAVAAAVADAQARADRFLAGADPVAAGGSVVRQEP